MLVQGDHENFMQKIIGSVSKPGFVLLQDSSDKACISLDIGNLLEDTKLKLAFFSFGISNYDTRVCIYD